MRVLIYVVIVLVSVNGWTKTPPSELPILKKSLFDKKYKPDYKIPKHLRSKPQLYAKGSECNTNGDLDCSAAVFAKILEIDPYDTTARANFAFALTGLGQHEQAVAEYKHVLNQGGGAYDTHFHYAQSLLALGEKKLALTHYQKTLELNPRLVDVVEKTAMILGDLNREKEGIRLIDNFIKKHKEAEQYLRSMRSRLHNKAVKL